MAITRDDALDTNWLRLASDLGAAITPPFTIFGWYYTPDEAGFQTIASVEAASGNNYCSTGSRNGGVDVWNPRAAHQAGGGATNKDNSHDTALYALNEWHFVVGEFVSATSLIVKTDDDTTVDEDTTEHALPTGLLRIAVGARRLAEAIPFGARIARVGIVNGVLTAQEHLLLFDGDWPPDVLGEDLLHLYDFANGALAVDSVGGADLTEEGTGTGLVHVADPAGFSYEGSGATKIIDATVQPAQAQINADAIKASNVDITVQPAQSQVTADVGAPVIEVSASVQPPAPDVAATTQLGRKTARGTAANDRQFFDETNNPHNAILFDFAWWDAIGIASLTDANKHLTGQVTTDVDGNWSVDLADTTLDIGDQGTLVVYGNLDPDLAILEIPVEFV